MKPITIKSCQQRAADKKLTLIQAFFEIYQERLDQGERPMSDVAYTQSDLAMECLGLFCLDNCTVI